MMDIMTLPITLDPEQQNIIQQAYSNAVPEIGEYEYAYIDNKMDAKLRVVAHVSIPWVARLSKYYSILNDILKQNHPSARNISATAMQAIAAALFYFINPYDIIPDMTPDRGYADDYYVFVLCLQSLDAADRDMIMKQLSDVSAV